MITITDVITKHCGVVPGLVLDGLVVSLSGQFSLQLSHQVSGCIYDIYMVIELKMIVVVVVVVVPLLLLLLLVLLQLLILLLVIVNIECGGACGSI